MLDFAEFIAINKFDRKGSLDALRDVSKQVQRNKEAWGTPADQMPVFGTMIRPCSVVSWLKSSGRTTCRPGWNNSARMVSAMMPPTINIARLKNRYSVPMSLWFVDVSQRKMPVG